MANVARRVAGAAPTRGPSGAGVEGANGAGGEISQTLDRGIQVLEAVAAAPEGLMVNDAAEALGVNRTVVYRLLTTLAKRRLVRRGPDGRYRLGTGVLEMARMLVPELRLAAIPELQRLAGMVQATAHLTVRDGDEAVAVAVVEPDDTDYHVAYRVGSRHPLDRGAAGIAILAVQPPSRGDSAAVKRARRDGFATSSGQLQAGAHGVAAPVIHGDCVEQAAIGLVALTRSVLEGTGPLVVEAARNVADALCTYDPAGR